MCNITSEGGILDDHAIKLHDEKIKMLMDEEI